MNFRAERDRQRLVQLVWAYFVLLILEGALRKWVAPQLSDVLLIVRDPVAAAIIYFAARDRYLPMDGPMRTLCWLLVGFVVTALLQLVVNGVPPTVLLFGLRTYFLHLPVIFVMARVLGTRDVRRLMLVLLVVAVPIAVLMVLQFRAGPADWINRGAGESGLQIRSSMGKIRAAGPFSFISGPVLFFSLTFACLIASHLNRMKVLALVQASAWTAVFVAAVVSGSRSLVAGLIPVLLATGLVLVKRPTLVGGLLRAAVTAAVIVVTIWGSTVVQEGLEVFDARWLESGGTQEIVQRSSETYVIASTAWYQAPLLGLGIGLGTNAGNALLGAGGFRFGESEWSRILYEAGPILGAAYLAWRLWLAMYLTRMALKAIAFGHVLPMVLIGAGFTNLILGPWGQPTTQGFAVFGAGLCLAACNALASDIVRFRRTHEMSIAMAHGIPAGMHGGRTVHTTNGHRRGPNTATVTSEATPFHESLCTEPSRGASRLNQQ